MIVIKEIEIDPVIRNSPKIWLSFLGNNFKYMKLHNGSHASMKYCMLESSLF